MNQIKCLIEKIWQKKNFLNMNWNIAKLGLGLQSSASANSIIQIQIIRQQYSIVSKTIINVK